MACWRKPAERHPGAVAAEARAKAHMAPIITRYEAERVERARQKKGGKR